MAYFSGTENYQLVIDVFKRDRKRFAPWAAFMAAVLDDDEKGLTREQREMVALRVSVLNDCHYCIDSHKAVLREQGVSSEEIERVMTGRSADPLLRELMLYVDKLTLVSRHTDQEDIDALLRAGWEEQDIEDTIQVVAMFAFMNRLVEGYGVLGTPQAYDMVGQSVAKGGYGPVSNML